MCIRDRGKTGPTEDGYTAPVAPTVISSTTSGINAIVLTMSSTLTNTMGDPEAFTVTSGTSVLQVNTVSVSDMTVTLTLIGTIVTGETITVGYSGIGTNALTNGALVSSFF